MLKLILATTVALTAAPAFADGYDMLARVTGVEPGKYTANEMTRIASAKTEQERSEVIAAVERSRAQRAAEVRGIVNGGGVEVTRSAN